MESRPVAAARPPIVIQLNQYDSAHDVIDALALQVFASGDEPCSRAVSLDRVRPDAPLVPPEADVVWRVVDERRQTVLARGEGWTLRAVRWTGETASVSVTARTDDLARAVIEAATDDAVLPVPDAELRTVIGFWHLTTCGARRRVRTIEARPWSAIRTNYSRRVASAVERVMRFRPETTVAGRLLLLHGPPGTGKTTAIRALAHAWRDWCDVDYVLDPERLLSNPDYLLHVGPVRTPTSCWKTPGRTLAAGGSSSSRTATSSSGPTRRRTPARPWRGCST